MIEEHVDIVFKVVPAHNTDNKHINQIINTLRGFQEGFPIEWRNQDCENASPGITDAQDRAQQAVRSIFKGKVHFNVDGYPRYEIDVPEGIDIKLIQK